MFLSAKKYKENVVDLLKTQTGVDIAVAFWGKGSDQLFLECLEAPRIICNLMAGATDPATILTLCTQFPKNVRHLTNLHSKIVISDNAMIVGSANFSSSGLTTNPDGQHGWEEAGVIVSESKEIKEARYWFERLWNNAAPVSPRDIELATITWNRNRDNRPVLSSARSLLDVPIEEFEDRKIYVALWTISPSDAAISHFDKARPTIAEQISSKDSEDVDFFQNATEYPEAAIIISAQILSRNRINIDGAWERVPEFDMEFMDEGVTETVQIVVKRKRILDHLFDSVIKKELAHIIQNYVRFVKNTDNSEYESGIVPLFRILQYRADAFQETHSK